MASLRLLSQMNRDVELGSDIDVSLLLTLLGNIFPPQDDLANNNVLQASLTADGKFSCSCAQDTSVQETLNSFECCSALSSSVLS